MIVSNGYTIEAAAECISELPSPIAIVDRSGLLIAVNPPLEALTQSTSAFHIQGGRLFVRHAERAEMFQKALATPGVQHLLLACDRMSAVLGMRVATGPQTSLISVNDKQDKPRISIGAANGLTRSEARIVERLLTDQTIEEIAEESGLAADTVRTHRKRAFAKLGVTSRSALLAWYLKLVA